MLGDCKIAFPTCKLMQEAVIKAFADKVPKVVVAAVDIVTTALRLDFKIANTDTLICHVTNVRLHPGDQWEPNSSQKNSHEQQSPATGL